MLCVMIGDKRFRTIAEAHAFLRDGGNADTIPASWVWCEGYVVHVN
jgi:hypothetical protein